MKRDSRKPFLIPMEGAVPATRETQRHKCKLGLFFFCSPPPLFSVPCSLRHNFKLPFLSVLRTHKDDKWFFMLPQVHFDAVMPRPSVQCSRVLLRVIGLNGVTIFPESRKMRRVSAPHSPRLSLPGAYGAWVAW